MDINRQQINALGQAMETYELLVKKDTEVKVTEERMINLSASVKYTILKNWGMIKNSYEAQRTVLGDFFRKSGGTALPGGMVTWMDQEKVTKAKADHKNDKTKLEAAMKKLREDAEKRSEAYTEEVNGYLDGSPGTLRDAATLRVTKGDKAGKSATAGKSAVAEKPAADLDLRAIKPTEADISILPDSLVMAYMDLNLMEEPIVVEEAEEK